MQAPHYTLVQIDAPHALAGKTYWQAATNNDQDSRFLGLFDDDGDPVTVGNASWTALRDDLAPPFDC